MCFIKDPELWTQVTVVDHKEILFKKKNTHGKVPKIPVGNFCSEMQNAVA